MNDKMFFQRKKEAMRLLKLWQHLLGSDAPSETQFFHWLKFHSPETVAAAIERTAGKALRSPRPMDADYRVRYCSRIANDLTFAAYQRAKSTISDATRDEAKRSAGLPTP